MECEGWTMMNSNYIRTSYNILIYTGIREVKVKKQKMQIHYLKKKTRNTCERIEENLILYYLFYIPLVFFIISFLII